MPEQMPRPVMLTVRMADGTETVFRCAGYETRAGALFIRSPLVRNDRTRVRSVSGGTIPRGEMWAITGELLLPWALVAWVTAER